MQVSQGYMWLSFCKVHGVGVDFSSSVWNGKEKERKAVQC